MNSWQVTPKKNYSNVTCEIETKKKFPKITKHTSQKCTTQRQSQGFKFISNGVALFSVEFSKNKFEEAIFKEKHYKFFFKPKLNNKRRSVTGLELQITAANLEMLNQLRLYLRESQIEKFVHQDEEAIQQTLQLSLNTPKYNAAHFITKLQTFSPLTNEMKEVIAEYIFENQESEQSQNFFAKLLPTTQTTPMSLEMCDTSSQTEPMDTDRIEAESNYPLRMLR